MIIFPVLLLSYMSWKPKTFQHDGLKDMHCRNCGAYLWHDSRLSDDKLVIKNCECGTRNAIHPPRKAMAGDRRVIIFGDSAARRDPMECTFTADYTE